MLSFMRCNDCTSWAMFGGLLVVMGATGLGAQLLSPFTLIGSINYIAVGTIIVLLNSIEMRNVAINYLPISLKSMLFDRYTSP